jgi:hypothetical protein
MAELPSSIAKRSDTTTGIGCCARAPSGPWGRRVAEKPDELAPPHAPSEQAYHFAELGRR